MSTSPVSCCCAMAGTRPSGPRLSRAAIFGSSPERGASEGAVPVPCGSSGDISEEKGGSSIMAPLSRGRYLFRDTRPHPPETRAVRAVPELVGDERFAAEAEPSVQAPTEMSDQSAYAEAPRTQSSGDGLEPVEA